MTYLITCDAMVGTRQVIASSEAEALRIAAARTPDGCKVVGTVEPVQATPVMSFSSEREATDFYRGQERALVGGAR